MNDISIRLRSDLFSLHGYIEGGICARKCELMGKEASGELASLIKQDIQYLSHLKEKVSAIMRQLGIEYEPQTS